MRMRLTHILPSFYCGVEGRIYIDPPLYTALQEREDVSDSNPTFPLLY